MEGLFIMANPSEESKIKIEEVAAIDRAELINGELIIKSYTTTNHNNAVHKISKAFEDFIENNNGDCIVFSDVVPLHCEKLCDNNNNNYFLPDIMVVCDKNGIKQDGVYVVPQFVAEIVSDSTRKFDYNNKLNTYRDIGVQEYWIVDLQKQAIIKNIMDDGVYFPEVIHYPSIKKLSVDTYQGLIIDLIPIFDFLKN